MKKDLAEFVAVLVVLTFLMMVGAGVAHGEDLADHNVQVHLLAHAETGSAAALVTHWAMRGSGLKPWQKLTCEIMAGLVPNIGYELVTEKSFDEAWKRIAAAGISAGSVGFSLEMKL